jgi:hypothetical protein
VGGEVGVSVGNGEGVSDGGRGEGVSDGTREVSVGSGLGVGVPIVTVGQGDGIELGLGWGVIVAIARTMTVLVGVGVVGGDAGPQQMASNAPRLTTNRKNTRFRLAMLTFIPGWALMQAPVPGGGSPSLGAL